MENQKSIELSLSDFLKKEGVDNIRDDETFCVAEYEAVRDYCLQKEFLLSSKDLLEIKSRRLEYSYDMWKEHFQEEKKRSFNQVFVKSGSQRNGVWRSIE